MAVLDFEKPLNEVATATLKAAVVKRRLAPEKASGAEDIPQRETDQLVNDLELHSTRSLKDRVTSALIVRELRQRVESGAMGKISWYTWAAREIKLGKTRLKEHMRVANAPNPMAEVNRLMRLAEARAKRLEDSKAIRDKAEWERLSVISFAKTHSIEQVRMLQRMISKMPRRI